MCAVTRSRRSSSAVFASALVAFAAIAVDTTRGANPASPKLENWQTVKFNCFNYAQASKANEFEQITGLGALLVYDQTKPAFTAANLTDSIAANYANFTSLGAPANPPATPANKSLVALVYDDTKGYTEKIKLKLARDAMGRPIPVPGMPGKFEFDIITTKTPKADFHWYRLNDKNNALDTNNIWSDKPGAGDAREFKNGAAYVTNPKTADRGRYNQFIAYYSIPEGDLTNLRPPPPTNGVGGDSPDFFDRPGPAARWGEIRNSGLRDDLGDVADVQGLIDHLPTGSPISDPQWAPWYFNTSDPYGGDQLITDLDLRSSLNASAMRVYQGVVEVYRPDNSVQFFQDDRGLSGFLHTQVPEPSSAAVLMLGVGSMLARRRRSR